MGLGIDFNPAAAATYQPPREPKPRQIVKQPKPLRVEESRLTAAEVKVKEGVPRALKEDEATQRANVAKVSRPLPHVQWVVPGLDNDDGLAHFAPSSVGTQNEAAVEAGMEAARNEALESYERHVDASADIRRNAAATLGARNKAADKEVRDYRKSSDEAAKAKVAAQERAGKDIQRAAARTERERQAQAERAAAAEEREEARRYDLWQAELAARARQEAQRVHLARSRADAARAARAEPAAVPRERVAPQEGQRAARARVSRSVAPPGLTRRATAAPSTPARPAQATRVPSPSASASASASGAGQAPSESSPQFHPPPPPGFEHLQQQADNLVWDGGFSMQEAISLVNMGISSKRSTNDKKLFYRGGHKIAVAQVKALLHAPHH